MLEYEWDNSVGYWICITSQAMRRALDAELSREQITFRQWEVLAWLSHSGEIAQGELADRMGVEAPTLAGIIQRMEKAGWLERTNCTEDRRRKKLHATDKAEAVWSRMVECCRRVRLQAIEGIPQEELATLKTVCERIRANLGDTFVPQSVALLAAATDSAE